jgi:hypothetical protein
MTNRRGLYAALAAGTIVVGLAVHFHVGFLRDAVRDFTGDALWAAMIVWLVSALAPTATILSRSLVALVICCAVEVSQLVHFPALDAFRQTTIGHLVLGSGFDPRDFAAYALGVSVAALLDRVTPARR